MGPYNEKRQLKRMGAVYRLLEQPNLSDWARNYWTTVFNTISRDEARYNARVKTVYSKMKRQETVAWDE